MATLTQRLTRDESIPDELHLGIHDFMAAITRVVRGRWTVEQIKVLYSSGTGEDGDFFEWMVGQIAAETDAAERIFLIQEVESILMLSERGQVPDHTNATEVEAELVALLT